MRDPIALIASALAAGRTVAVASLLGVEGSGPQPPGALLVVTEDGELAGTVGGGCVDGTLAAESLEPTTPVTVRMLEYAVEDGPWAVGPLCGGRLRVLLERLTATDDRGWAAVHRAVAAGRPVARLTRLDDLAGTPTVLTSADLVDRAPGSPVDRAVEHARRVGRPVAELHAAEQTAVQLWPRPLALVVVGADAVGVAVAELAAAAGHRVTVVDHRPLFTRADRFPAGVTVITDQPDRYLRAALSEAEHPSGEHSGDGAIDGEIAVVVLSHDTRTEIPALVAALSHPAVSFVGALGSRETHRRRVALLVAAGVPEDRVAGLRAPLGLDLGGTDPAATAVSILAELIADRHGGTGEPLHRLDAPVHQEPRPAR